MTNPLNNRGRQQVRQGLAVLGAFTIICVAVILLSIHFSNTSAPAPKPTPTVTQSVTVPPSTVTATVTAPAPTTSTSTGHAPLTYTVVKGDTLSAIADHFNIKSTDLYNANKATIGDNPTAIVPGMVLTIPSE